MKARKIIGGVTALVGLVAAISVADGSAHEILIRGAGVAVFSIGAYVAQWFSFQKQ